MWCIVDVLFQKGKVQIDSAFLSQYVEENEQCKQPDF